MWPAAAAAVAGAPAHLGYAGSLLEGGRLSNSVRKKHAAGTGEDTRLGGDEMRLLQAMLEARSRASKPNAAAILKVSDGIWLPPRAQRIGELRSLRGLLDALMTEGTSAPLPDAAPAGLSVALKDYQRESLGWMLAREHGDAGMEDLLETTWGDVRLSVLPADGELTFCTLSQGPAAPRHFGGVLAEEMVRRTPKSLS